MEEAKDAIGEWHDWEELASTASEVLDHDNGCKLLAQLKRIASEKFERALNITNTMRSKYVTRNGKQKSGRTVPLPVLIAQSGREPQARSTAR